MYDKIWEIISGGRRTSRPEWEGMIAGDEGLEGNFWVNF
jgi:hypothetical protein